MGDKHVYKKFIVKNNYKVIDCAKCGFWHIYPIPSKDELNDYYEKKYYKTLKNNKSMVDKIKDKDGFITLQYEDRLRRIIKCLSRKMKKSLIDLGAGYGDYLIFMKNKGWKVSGIEPSNLDVNHVYDNKINIKFGNIEELYSELKPSSVVTLNNVLEHLPNPGEILDIVKNKLLLPGGIVSIIVPNDFNILQNIIMKSVIKNQNKAKNYWVALPDHINYWSTVSIKKFLERKGFKILYSACDFPIEIFQLMGYEYITNPGCGRDAHLMRVRFEKHIESTKNFEFKDKLYEAFERLGMGRTVHVIASKK